MGAQLALVHSPDGLAKAGAAPAFELLDLSRRYGYRWALSRLTFRLEAGRSLLLTGHNGSGKTTLLKVLATQLRPTAGAVRVLGFDGRTCAADIRCRTSLLSHASYAYEDLTAQQNLVLLARLLGKPDPVAASAEQLARVGLTSRAHHPVRQFSAGMRKRLAIARVLLKRPRLALLDEPFGELDPEGIALMEEIIGELKATGTTLVLATHLVEQGERLTEARLHLEGGRMVGP
jgi:heme exporter protein A